MLRGGFAVVRRIPLPMATDGTLDLELKLGLTRRFRLPELAGEPIPPRLVTATYYDSADLRLTRAGVTLRRRVERRRGAWQLKLQRGGARVDLELPGAPGALPEQLRDLVTAYLRGAELQPVGVVRTRRSGVHMTDADGPLAEVTVDAAAVVENGRVVRSFRDLEAELVDDTANGRKLRRLERALRAAGAVDGDPRPKVCRALDIPAPVLPSPAGARASLPEHLQAMLAVQYREILLHDPGTRLGTDPEELHQMRVATRRLRAFLRAARPFLELEWAETLRAELGWLGGILGRVRDLDVLLDRLHEDARTLDPADQRPLGRVYALLQQEREADRELLLEALRGDRYLALLDRLESAVAAPRVVTGEGSLRDIATAEFRRLRKAVRALPPGPHDDEELHALRIRGKRARYAAELAEPVVGKAATRFIQAAKELQDVLGEHQDSVVAEQRIRAAVRRLGGKGVPFAAGRLVERERERRAAARAAWPGAWKTLKRAGKAAWR